jgi:hypothetical protein
MSRKKFAIISSHRIQYYAPIFRALTASGCIESRVFYTWSQAVTASIHDPGFGQVIRWDVPLPEASKNKQGCGRGSSCVDL